MCTVLMDSEGFSSTEIRHRCQMIDAGPRGIHIIITNLKLEDTGAYWVGIDKIYADIMTYIHLIVTLEAVSKPQTLPLSSILGTCWGKPVSVRCASAKGSTVHYTWYQLSNPQDIQFQSSADLHLHCGVSEEDRQYYCKASNDVSSQRSDLVFLKVLKPSEEDCIYSISLVGQRSYNCSDRLKTSTAPPVQTSTCQHSDTSLTSETYHSEIRNRSSPSNQTHQDWVWTVLPVWYEVLRWLFLAILITAVCFMNKWTQV
ncbi:uncharacterized protein LOC109616418 [Esox lucius]|uniref:uncharacterized protein LOC109616418 n=1 Tax=Esox lucius TaxID=8010 RepID=UPI0009734B8D|nr:uncharacterized protein LOC109616418 [Esox lucius]